jgi:hypothetical protein
MVYLEKHLVITCFVGGELSSLKFKPWVANLKHKIGKNNVVLDCSWEEGFLLLQTDGPSSM